MSDSTCNDRHVLNIESQVALNISMCINVSLRMIPSPGVFNSDTKLYHSHLRACLGGERLILSKFALIAALRVPKVIEKC